MKKMTSVTLSRRERPVWLFFFLVVSLQMAASCLCLEGKEERKLPQVQGTPREKCLSEVIDKL